jgi:hypothetical protein
MGRKSKRTVTVQPFCYYCDREFDDEATLIDHQRAKHFKCPSCHKKLTTIGALMTHSMQVHKEKITAVANAKEGRTSVDVQIYGMEGIPPEMMHSKRMKLMYGEGEGSAGAAVYPPGAAPFLTPTITYPQTASMLPPGSQPFPPAVPYGAQGPHMYPPTSGPVPPMPAHLMPPQRQYPASAYPPSISYPPQVRSFPPPSGQFMAPPASFPPQHFSGGAPLLPPAWAPQGVPPVAPSVPRFQPPQPPAISFPSGGVSAVSVQAQTESLHADQSHQPPSASSISAISASSILSLATTTTTATPLVATSSTSSSSSKLPPLLSHAHPALDPSSMQTLVFSRDDISPEEMRAYSERYRYDPEGVRNQLLELEKSLNL